MKITTRLRTLEPADVDYQGRAVHLDAESVLHRLYHQEEVRLFDPIDVRL